MTADIEGRAARARAELRETEAAFEKIRASAIERLFASKAGDTELRETLYQTVNVIDAVRKELRMVVDNGLIEEAKQQRIERRSAMAKREQP